MDQLSSNINEPVRRFNRLKYAYFIDIYFKYVYIIVFYRRIEKVTRRFEDTLTRIALSGFVTIFRLRTSSGSRKLFYILHFLYIPWLCLHESLLNIEYLNESSALHSL